VPIATYESFEAVRDLDQNALRDLLTNGDRAERIWAAWALAAILGNKEAPDILAQGEIGQSPGVRRQLLVILAGLGERLIIRVMAEGDPSPVVRAASCQYLIQTWVPGETETTNVLKFCLFADPASEVRDEILKCAALDRLGLGLADLVALANDPSGDVRDRVIGLVRDRYPAAEISASGLYKRLAIEDQRDLLTQLGRLALDSDGPGRVLAAAEAQSPQGALILLELLIGAKAKFDWPALNGLASRRDPDTDLRILRLLGKGGGPVAFAWLVHAIATRLKKPGVPDWDFIEESWQPLAEALGDIPAAVVASLKSHLDIIIGYVDTIPEPEPGDDQAGDRRHHFVELRRKLNALVGPP
jgi:hypothetical protein